MKKKRWVAFLWMLMGLSACSSLNQKPLHVEESKNINKTEQKLFLSLIHWL